MGIRVKQTNNTKRKKSNRKTISVKNLDRYGPYASKGRVFISCPDRTGKGFLLFIIHPPRFRLWSRYTCNTWVLHREPSRPRRRLFVCMCSRVCILHTAVVRVVRYYETKLFKRNLNFHYGFNLYFTRRIGSRDKCDIILYKCVCVCVYNVYPTKVSKNKCKHTAHFNIQVWCFPAWTWLKERKCGILNVNIQGVSPCGCSRAGHICIILYYIIILFYQKLILSTDSPFTFCTLTTKNMAVYCLVKCLPFLSRYINRWSWRSTSF